MSGYVLWCRWLRGKFVICTAVDEDIRPAAASHDPPLTAEHATTFTLTDLGNDLGVQLTNKHTQMDSMHK